MCGERTLRAGLHRADHRHRTRLAQRGQRIRRCRVARDQHELHAAIEQEALAAERVLLDGTRALVAVRNARRIAEIDDVLAGQRTAKGPHDRQPAHA